MIGKAKGRKLNCWGLTLLPPDAATPLFHIEGSAEEFSRELSPLLDSLEHPYKEDLNWLQFAYMGDSKGAYMALANMAFSFASLVEGEPLFALEHLQTLYPGAYTWGTMVIPPWVQRAGVGTTCERAYPYGSCWNLFIPGGR